jgi:predicted nuclease of predicted toxin-antitoxin system
MRFLLDMNLPPAIAERLRAEGHDAVHLRDVGGSNLSDSEIFELANKEHRIVITFDLDFGEIAAAALESGSGVALLRLRLAQQSYLWDRLRAGITAAGWAMEVGAVVLIGDARVRIRHPPRRS